MTPHDWALLSEWIDGGLTGEAKAEFEARLQREPDLAEAARRMKTLEDTARTLTPTAADAEAWKKAAPRSLPLGPILGVLLVVAAATWLLARGAELPSAAVNAATSPASGGSANAPTGTAPGVNASSPASGNLPSGNAPSGNAPSGNAPSGNAPSGNAPSGNSPSINSPSINSPSINSPSGNVLSNDAPSGHSLSINSLSINSLSGNSLSGNSPSGNSPSGNVPSGNVPSGNVPSANQPTANQPTANQPTPTEPSNAATSLTRTDAGAQPNADLTQPIRPPDAGVPPMPFRPDASTPLVVAAIIATTAQAGTPPTVHVNPGEPWLIHSPRSEVTVTPDGAATVRPLGDKVTRISADQPAKLQVTSTPSDGGTPTVVILDVSAQRDLEFTIPLDVGSSRQIWAPGRVRFAVGSSATARVTEDGDKLRVEGVQPGETSVEAWFADGAHLTWPVRVTARSEPDVIELRVGSQKIVTLQAGQKASLEDPSLARVQPLGKQVLVIGMRPGRSALLLTGDDAGVRRRPLVVTGAAIDEEPVSTESVTLSPSPREQGPWRVRQNHALRFTSPAGLSRVRTTTELVLTSMKNGAVLVRGAAPGRAVIDIGFDDGAEVRLTVVVDP